MVLKVGRITVIVGVIIIILGSVFHLQGKSVVGPESSFMYANSDWISYGTQIAVSGIIITGIGLFLRKINR